MSLAHTPPTDDGAATTGPADLPRALNYSPKPGTLAWHCVALALEYPDHDWTAALLAAALGSNSGQVANVLTTSVAARLLETDTTNRRRTVYRAGPRALTVMLGTGWRRTDKHQLDDEARAAMAFTDRIPAAQGQPSAKALASAAANIAAAIHPLRDRLTALEAQVDALRRAAASPINAAPAAPQADPQSDTPTPPPPGAPVATFRPNSIAHRVCVYCHANPGAAFAAYQLATRLNLNGPQASIAQAIGSKSQAVARGYLRIHRQGQGSGNPIHWSAGPTPYPTA